MADTMSTLESTGKFRILVSLLRLTGVDEVLNGPETYTLLAPTDAAFAKILPEQLDDLVRNIPRLRNILLYHIIPGAYTSAELIGMDQFKTLQGESVGMRPTKEMDFGKPGFTAADIKADNVIIHAVDTVLLPTAEATEIG